jgi:hypothetical protein
LLLAMRDRSFRSCPLLFSIWNTDPSRRQVCILINAPLCLRPTCRKCIRSSPPSPLRFLLTYFFPTGALRSVEPVPCSLRRVSGHSNFSLQNPLPSQIPGRERAPNPPLSSGRRISSSGSLGLPNPRLLNPFVQREKEKMPYELPTVGNALPAGNDDASALYSLYAAGGSKLVALRNFPLRNEDNSCRGSRGPICCEYISNLGSIG